MTLSSRGLFFWRAMARGATSNWARLKCLESRLLRGFGVLDRRIRATLRASSAASSEYGNEDDKKKAPAFGREALLCQADLLANTIGLEREFFFRRCRLLEKIQSALNLWPRLSNNILKDLAVGDQLREIQLLRHMGDVNEDPTRRKPEVGSLMPCRQELQKMLKAGTCGRSIILEKNCRYLGRDYS